jgi:hypothetical protein
MSPLSEGKSKRTDQEFDGGIIGSTKSDFVDPFAGFGCGQTGSSDQEGETLQLKRKDEG